MHHLFALAALWLPATLAAKNLQGRTMPGSSLFERQFRICSSVPDGPNLCERSCGAGYETCVSLPNCFNPTVGQICCSNGNYCDADEYCTDAGCCPIGTPISECGGTYTVTLWGGFGDSSTVETPTSTPTPTPTPSEYSTTTTTTSSSYSSPSSYSSSSSSTTPPIYTPPPSPPVNGTSITNTATPPPATYTGGVVRGEVAGWAMGGLGLLGLGFLI